MKLNLGCGRNIREGWLNVDRVALREDVYIWDLGRVPWPWPVNEFEEVYASHILEHLADKMQIIEEIWRVCEDGATVEIRVPAWNHPLLWQDPTHRSAWHIDNFDYFQLGHNWSYYTEVRFEIQVKEERFFAGGPELHWILRVIKKGR